MRNKQLDLGGLIRVIEMDDSVLAFLSTPTNQNSLKSSIDHLRSMVEKQRRRLAKKYHPDVGGNLERMKEINDACDLLMKIEVVPPRPRPSPGSWDFNFSYSKRPAWGTGFTTYGS